MFAIGAASLSALLMRGHSTNHSTFAFQYSHHHRLPHLHWTDWSESLSGVRTMRRQRYKSQLTLLLLSIISESPGWFLFALLLIISSLSFGLLVSAEEEEEEEKERREEKDDFLLPLAFLPDSSSFSSWFKIEKNYFFQNCHRLENKNFSPPGPHQECVDRCRSACGFPDRTSDAAQTPPGC